MSSCGLWVRALCVLATLGACGGDDEPMDVDTGMRDGQMGVGDASADSGDSGAIDAAEDTGSTDGGAPDALAVDAGADANTDADAGTDAGVDAGPMPECDEDSPCPLGQTCRSGRCANVSPSGFFMTSGGGVTSYSDGAATYTIRLYLGGPTPAGLTQGGSYSITLGPGAGRP